MVHSREYPLSFSGWILTMPEDVVLQYIGYILVRVGRTLNEVQQRMIPRRCGYHCNWDR